MKKLLIIVDNLINKEDGLNIIEYGIIIALVILFAVGVITLLGGNIAAFIK